MSPCEICGKKDATNVRSCRRAETIAEAIKKELTSLNLKYEILIAFGFDVAANMAGNINGVRRKLSEKANKEENREKRRKLWQKEWLKRRDIGFGALHLLHEELRLEDKTSFKSFLRMNEDCFMLLLSKVEHKIRREDTKFRESVKPRDRLSITLRFLATGESFQSTPQSLRHHEDPC
ncbi:hypothetical protein CBL_09983 [Carabus blaptoides fortunei]